jgi:hypothetical protein
LHRNGRRLDMVKGFVFNEDVDYREKRIFAKNFIGDGSQLSIEGVEENLKKSLTNKVDKQGLMGAYYQPPKWGYEGSSKAWQELWHTTIELLRDSILSISIVGHWKTGGNWAYLGAMFDGKSIHPEPSNCWGATHTYLTQWHPIGYRAMHAADAGKHTLGVGVVVNEGIVNVNGTRLNYLVIPK